MKPTIVFDGESTNRDADLDSIIASLQEKRAYLHAVPIEELIVFMDALTHSWESTGVIKKYPYLKNLTDFLAKATLSKRLQIALHGNYQALDAWIDLGDPQFLFHAQPRGLAVQWLAGNVAVLGMFSIFSALLTKNVSLVKASSRGYEELVGLLDTLRTVKTSAVNGAELARTIAVVLIDRTDTAAHEKLSRSADVRIAWGGSEAIETIQHLPKSIFCEDIIFGPKYSYAVIDHDTLTADSKKVAQRLAVDASVFDQYACSSPHTVFVQGSETEALAFAKLLSEQMEFVQKKMVPKGTIDSAKAMEIVTLRSTYELSGKVFQSSGTEWTVIYTTEPGLAKGCFSRVIFVKPVQDLASLGSLNDRQKQSLGVGLTQESKLQYLDAITLRGIDRAPELGTMTFYESPWDGMFVFDRLVRWVTVSKK